MPECLFEKGDRQSEKKRRNSDRKVIGHVTHGIDAGRVVIHHCSVSEGSEWARPFWRSDCARTKMGFADEPEE